MKSDEDQYEALITQADQLRLAGQIENEIQLRRQLLQLRPHDTRCELSLALALLLLGRYEEAWPHYEARLSGPVAIQAPSQFPRWDGKSTLPELLIIAEQGIGDLVQFLRYIPLLKLTIPKVSIVAAANCHSLLRHCGLFETIADFGDPLDLDQDSAWLPLLSLPKELNLRANQVLVNGTYLKPEPARQQAWHQRLRTARGDNLIIGLHWQGNPRAEQGSAEGRSIALEHFMPLAGINGVQLVSLQKGPGTEQLQHCQFLNAFVDCQQEVNEAWDLVETLAILSACDLIITNDSGLAHLAGALGRPTWVLLKAVPDWRWGLTGETTPWYPSMRLFRQPSAGNWSAVVAAVVPAVGEALIQAQSHVQGLQGSVLGDDERGCQLAEAMDLIGPLLTYRDAIFQAHCKFILDTYLDPWINFFHSPSPYNGKLEAVIVETRPTKTLRAVVLNALLMLPAGTKIILITSRVSETAMVELFAEASDHLEIRAEALDPNFNQQSYNRLLSDTNFWQSFSADCILIFQSDSLLLTPLPEAFLSVPYLGAPWHSDGVLTMDFPYQMKDQQLHADGPVPSFARTSLVLSPGLNNLVPHGYGNGGLSIRNRALMETIATDQTREPGEPEDVFFSRHLPAYCKTLPNIEMARQFSVESIYADAVGLHASWKYLPTDKQALLYEKHIKTLISMAEGLL
jgi:hypothetical protein